MNINLNSFSRTLFLNHAITFGKAVAPLALDATLRRFFHVPFAVRSLASGVAIALIPTSPPYKILSAALFIAYKIYELLSKKPSIPAAPVAPEPKPPVTTESKPAATAEATPPTMASLRASSPRMPKFEVRIKTNETELSGFLTLNEKRVFCLSKRVIEALHGQYCIWEKTRFVWIDLDSHPLKGRNHIPLQLLERLKGSEDVLSLSDSLEIRFLQFPDQAIRKLLEAHPIPLAFTGNDEVTLVQQKCFLEPLRLPPPPAPKPKEKEKVVDPKEDLDALVKAWEVLQKEVAKEARGIRVNVEIKPTDGPKSKTTQWDGDLYLNCDRLFLLKHDLVPALQTSYRIEKDTPFVWFKLDIPRRPGEYLCRGLQFIPLIALQGDFFVINTDQFTIKITFKPRGLLVFNDAKRRLKGVTQRNEIEITKQAHVSIYFEPLKINGKT